MNVQIVENWTNIVGEVRSYTFEGEIPGFASVEIAVTQTQPVEKYPGIFFPNFLENATNQVIHVNVPQSVAAQLKITPGANIVCRVRCGGLTSIFVHPQYISVTKH